MPTPRLQVRSAALTGYAELARSLGLEPGALARQAGVRLNALASPDVPVPARAAYRLLECGGAGAPRRRCRAASLKLRTQFNVFSMPPSHSVDDPNPPLSRYLLLHLLANASQWVELQDALGDTKLGRPHTRVLFVLYSAPGITINELLSAMHESHQNLTTPIKKLIAEGYAVTESDPADRRRKLMFLSTKGKRFVLRVLKQHDKRLGSVIAGIPPKDFETFLRVHALLVDRNDEPWFQKLTGHAPVRTVA